MARMKYHSTTSNLRAHLITLHPGKLGELEPEEPQLKQARSRIRIGNLPSDAVRTSGRRTPDLPSGPLPGNITNTLRKNFKKKLNSIMDSLLKSTVSEITNAFDAVTFDHQMVVKQKIEEISLLRFKLEKAEKKLLEQNGKWDQKEVVTHTSGQILPEITVDVPDDWCAPLGCENVVEQTPSTSYAAREDGSSSLCSLSVSLWRLPDIKQEALFTPVSNCTLVRCTAVRD
ncbi:hypothetical protein N1851_012310 [Merluccius polli]|uniref:Uncharacterized protein n=1 Tax=Merluccius polli TaxID=89951 RepID=A0AA47P2D9_MERPO|nr:hypothetical protein N1851_012310 [Merluccius polli]